MYSVILTPQRAREQRRCTAPTWRACSGIVKTSSSHFQESDFCAYRNQRQTRQTFSSPESARIGLS